MPTQWPDWQPWLVSFLLGLILTPFARSMARWAGMTAPVRPDRWHKKPTALLGGTAILMATVVGVLAFMPLASPSLMILSGATLVGLVGLIDDIWHISPRQKLAAQLVAASILMLTGGTWPMMPWEPINVLLTLFWLIGITNGLNLLDNMDGLSAGVAALTSGALATFFFFEGHIHEATLSGCLAGGLIAFLLYNFNPATIFMGDCGSLFLGFVLAGLAVRLCQLQPARPWDAAGLMLLLFATPIFDTSLVTILRTREGLPVSRGGRDHSSHRLVACGLSERLAVVLLWGVTALGAIVGMVAWNAGSMWMVAAVAGHALLLLNLGVYLSHIDVYGLVEETASGGFAQPSVEADPS